MLNKSSLKKKTLKKSEINKLNKIQLKEELNNVIETLTIAKLKNLLILLTEETNIKNTDKSVKIKKDNTSSIVELVNSIEIIDDTGIEKKNSNGGRTQTLLMKYKDKIWKLVIHSESYWFQSYIRLYSLQGVDNWALIKQGNPKRDYSLDISYRNDYRENIFFGIINDYKYLIARLEK